MAGKKTYRVSIKGILVHKGRVLLLRKANRTWDLPGGRIEEGESATRCLLREFHEETGLRAEAGDYAGAWTRHRRNKPDVFTLAFFCRPRGKVDHVRLSDEHIDAGFFGADEVRHLRMVEACRDAILAQLPKGKGR